VMSSVAFAEDNAMLNCFLKHRRNVMHTIAASQTHRRPHDRHFYRWRLPW
jgi:hypothetical protein